MGMPSVKQPELLATPCVTCREHHLKCDRTIPRCGRCVRAGRECRLSFKFKPSQAGSFKKTQKWIRAPKKLTYVDETQYLTTGSPPEDVSFYQIHEDDASSNSHSSPQSEPSDPVVHGSIAEGGRQSRRSDAGIGAVSDDARSTTSSSTPLSHGGPHCTDLVVAADARPDQAPSPQTASSSSPLDLGSLSLGGANPHSPLGPLGGNIFGSVVASTSVLPLKTRTEALLFRHYIQKLATCLDLCDPLRNFELVVPERVGMCPTLLNACLAIAARHLSHTTDFDPLVSTRYNEECLKYLNPMLGSSTMLSDENLFAATIILRMLEEIDSTYTGHDNYSHLLGIQCFVNVGDQIMLPGSLSAASFWAGLRQEIYIAVVAQQPVKINLDHYIVDRSYEPTDDSTWSNRAIVHLADVLNFCFGETPPSSHHWNMLNEASKQWAMSRPFSFSPYFYRERNAPAEAFPEIWHGSSCHVIGIQHHMLAQLFLTQFDPNIPRVGTNRRAATKRANAQIETIMRELCGIGNSNQWSPPAMFTACMGIATFGDQFSERPDQEALLELLRKTEGDFARPTLAIQQQLMKAWGWIPDSDE